MRGKSYLFFIALISLAQFACTKSEELESNTEADPFTIPTFTDPRDGESYTIVEIDGQCWMAENLRYDVDNALPLVYDTVYSAMMVEDGRLYNYHAAMLACPDGWHLPSKTEFQALIDHLGPDFGDKIKSSSGWLFDNNGTNESGLNVMPVGIDVFGSHDYKGRSAALWCSEPLFYGTGYALNVNQISSETKLGQNSDFLGFSCRCIKDQ